MSDTEDSLNLEEDELEAIIEPNPDPFESVKPNWSLRFILLFIVAFGIGIASGYMIWGRNGGQAADVAAASTQTGNQTLQQSQSEDTDAELVSEGPVAEEPQYQIPDNIQRYDVDEGGNPAWGPADAPITIIEFSDYECPFCTKWHDEVWPLLQANYGDQIRLVYRDFPLVQIHPNATPAAVAANCAGEQEAYWEFNDLMFSGQYRLNVSSYQAAAEALNLELEAFNECLDSGRYNEEVLADLEYARNLGVQSTPTFFINGLAVVGAQPYDLFEFIIEKELKGEIP